MGGPIESFVEPLVEKILGKIFPVFKDRNEVKIGMNHFLTHAWITLTLSSFGVWWLASASFFLVPIAEYNDWMKGRWVDTFTRGAGWAWGMIPIFL